MRAGGGEAGAGSSHQHHQQARAGQHQQARAGQQHGGHAQTKEAQKLPARSQLQSLAAQAQSRKAAEQEQAAAEQEQRAAREAAAAARQAVRRADKAQFFKRNARGQPVMGVRISKILGKLQRS